MHARDAQEAAGHAGPLPAVVAADGVEEFLTVCIGACGPWPHRPARIAVRASEGPAWQLDLSEQGAVVVAAAPGPAATPEAAASLSGTASDLVLFLYGRLGQEAVQVGGDGGLVRQLTAWASVD